MVETLGHVASGKERGAHACRAIICDERRRPGCKIGTSISLATGIGSHVTSRRLDDATGIAFAAAPAIRSPSEGINRGL
jgi:hypothetical protein